MKTILQLLIITGLLGMSTGCEKLVDVKPESQITEQVYFQSEGDFEPYVIGTYIFLRGSARTGPGGITGIVNNLTYGTERGEELVSALNSRFTNAWTHNITPTSSAFDYTTWYKAIGNCNLLLEKIADFPFNNEDNKKRIMAETYCIRAYTFFSLTR